MMVKLLSQGARVILETQSPVPAKAPSWPHPVVGTPASCWEGPSPLFPTHRALVGLNSSEGCDPYFVSIWLPKRGLLCLFFFLQKGKKDSPTFHLCLPGALAGVGVLGAGPLLVTKALGPSPE